jgi:16S rRNA (cytosine967-C5)-methyltransferase
MRPAARLAAAMEILDAILAGEAAERALLRWARASRFAGSKDRAAVRDVVFDCLRRRRSLGWRGGGDSGRALVLAHQAEAGAELDALFPGGGHDPAPPDEAERAALARGLADAPRAARLDIPDFLEPELVRSLGAAFEPVLEAMRRRAPVDLRVNALKADRAAAVAALALDAIEAAPLPLAPFALRVTAGARRVAQSQAYRDGLVELQDVSSQRVAAMAGARPGMAVLDFCAGGGGKTLALAAAMAGRGRLVAYDANPARMKGLPARAARAGARADVARDAAALGRAPGWDLVFVDAPCSGSGAWRRTPEAKWRLRPDDLRRLAGLQDAILAEAAALVRPGGALVYATCSLLVCENEDRVGAFLRRRPGWRQDEAQRFGPLDGGGDGFFGARLLAPGGA